MSKSFLFIIPLTPASHLTEIRKELQEKCLLSLKGQDYQNWSALLIGKDKPTTVTDNRFIHLPIEDIKEVKIQHATKFIIEEKIACDYIIRLDDDDLISESTLELNKNTNADLIVDLEHWFIDWNSKKASKSFNPWFPNTCIHKTTNALSVFGKLAQDYMEKINENTLLIENNHSEIHNFYKGKKIIFTPSNSPVYLRVLNPDSITSNSDDNYADYLKKYGNWDQSKPLGFSKLNVASKGKKVFNLKNYLHSKLSAFKFKLLLK